MDLSKIKQLYTDNLQKHGVNPKSVGWTKEGSQELRFEKLLQVVENPSMLVTINELGCGYGELFKFCERVGLNVTEFNGYDISSEMLSAAKEYLNSAPQVRLIESDKLETMADYSITSGIFNVLFDHDIVEWEQYVKNTLANMFENSKKGISFNGLTSFVDYESKDLYYANPLLYFEFCKREFSRKVNLIHDYDLFEWTIIVKR